MANAIIEEWNALDQEWINGLIIDQKHWIWEVVPVITFDNISLVGSFYAGEVAYIILTSGVTLALALTPLALALNPSVLTVKPQAIRVKRLGKDF
ncbi:hypothetical protein B7463_g11291, partial [Scytalidium lignicola]